MKISKGQRIAMRKCEEMDNKGEAMDCAFCSCGVCIAQIPTRDKELREVLQKMKKVEKNTEELELSGIKDEILKGIQTAILLLEKAL